MKTKNTDFESSYYTWHCSIIKYWTRSREQMHIMHAVYDSVMSPRYSKIYFLQSILEMANHFSYSFFHPHFLSVFSTAPVWYHRGAWPGCSFNSWREPLYLLTFILNFLMCCGLNFETVWKIYLDKSFWDPKGLVIPFKKSFDSMAKLIWVCLTSSQCVM